MVTLWNLKPVYDISWTMKISKYYPVPRDGRQDSTIVKTTYKELIDYEVFTNDREGNPTRREIALLTQG